MNKIFAIAMTLLVCGCSSQPTFKEGTLFDCGLYVPYNGSLYGCEICSYVNGCKVTVPTNHLYEISRKHFATNSYFFGMFETRESSDTNVKLLDFAERK